MKVAFIVNEFPCISETFILNQVTGLLDQGFDVQVFARYKPSSNLVHPDILRYQLFEKTMYPHDIMPLEKAKKWRMVWELFRKNIFKHPVVILRALNFIKYGRNALNFKYFLYAMRFVDKDVVLCHFGTNGADSVFLKGLLRSKIKHITVFHAYELTKSEYVEKYPYDELFLKGDLFLPISYVWKERLIASGCPAEKVVVHRMGVDTDQFSLRSRPVETDEIRLLSVARLVEKKGLEYSIKAVAKLAVQYPKIRYVIVGDGPLKEKLQELIDRLNAGGHVVLKGAMNAQSIHSLMNGSHFFILTSVTAQDGDQEGLPVSLMEAMAMGLPVVASRHSGIPEMIVDGVNGLLVPEKDVEAIIQKLGYLIEHREIWPKFSSEGRKTIEEHFDIKKLNQRLIRIFDTPVSQEHFDHTKVKV